MSTLTKCQGLRGRARVLTSSENLERLNDKERKKEEATREKHKKRGKREEEALLEVVVTSLQLHAPQDMEQGLRPIRTV